MTNLFYVTIISSLTTNLGSYYLAQFPDIPKFYTNRNTSGQTLYSWLKTAKEFGEDPNQYSGLPKILMLNCLI